jgi:hypothetical protein
MPRDLFAGISLTSPPSMIGTTQAAGTSSPVYSPTSPASDEEEAKQGDPPQAATAAVPVAPTLASAEKQVQQALQTLVATATRNQWEGATPRGPPPTWEQMLYHMGQGRKGVSTGGPGLETKADHEWVRLRQGIAIKVAMLMRLDTKDVVECNEMMIIMVRGKHVDVNEAVRSRVTTWMLDHLEDAFLHPPRGPPRRSRSPPPRDFGRCWARHLVDRR